MLVHGADLVGREPVHRLHVVLHDVVARSVEDRLPALVVDLHELGHQRQEVLAQVLQAQPAVDLQAAEVRHVGDPPVRELRLADVVRRAHRAGLVVRPHALERLVHRAVEHPIGQPPDRADEQLALDLVLAVPEQRVLRVRARRVRVLQQLGEHLEQRERRAPARLRDVGPGKLLSDHHACHLILGGEPTQSGPPQDDQVVEAGRRRPPRRSSRRTAARRGRSGRPGASPGSPKRRASSPRTLSAR